MKFPTETELELNLDVVLRELGWTQSMLAKRMSELEGRKVNRQWIFQLVNNQHKNVPMNVLQRLSGATGYPIEKLLRAKQ